MNIKSTLETMLVLAALGALSGCGSANQNSPADQSSGGSGATGVGGSGATGVGGSGGAASGCPAGEAQCGGACLNLMSSSLSCGTCGKACDSGRLCLNGSCACQGGLTACSATCTDTQSDGNNCGSCGNACTGGRVCSAGSCAASCSAGQTQCGSSCVDLTSNGQNCGLCGTTCSVGQVCSAGSCMCPGSQSSCSGACTDTQSDGNNCGSCGHQCGGGQTCASGTCMGGAGGMGGSGGTSGAGAGGKGSGGAGAGGAGAGGAGAGGAGMAGSGGSSTGTCGQGDGNLPAEPTIPPACTTLQAAQAVSATGVPSESNLDTQAIQNALNGCGSGKAVRLVTNGSNNAFITGPITIPSGVGLWVDAGATLYGTRNPTVYNNASSLIAAKGSGSGIYGDGAIDGQGGEPRIGSTTSFWDQNGGGGSSPALIQVSGATNFTIYRITLHNAPMFHVKMNANGFVAWGVTIKTPSKSTNSAGTALSYTSAHNTDGIDPGEAASNGYIVCNKITTGDDHIAIKGSSSTGVTNLTIAHNHFEAGHGMSIGSEFTGGVSSIKVYDLSVDQIGTGTGGGSSNGIRIKSDSSRGGLVNNVTYSDVCMRGVANPILLTPFYSTATGSSIPQFTNIKFQDIHVLTGGNTPKITLDGYDGSHLNSVTLDNVIVDSVSAANVSASYTKVTLGPGNVNFTPSGTGVTVTNSISGSSTPNPCTGKWVTF